jgi:SAM-dependent methyltransferase
MPSINFDRAADVYDATRSLPQDEMEMVLMALENVLRGCSSVLDIGVGTGRFASPLQSLGLRVYGIDISRKMMSKAAEKGVRDLVGGDAGNLPFVNGAFDAALLVHVLHLVQNPAGVLREVARVTSSIIVATLETVEGERPRMMYGQLLAKMGKPTGRFDQGEAGLSTAIPPYRLVRVLEKETELDAEEEITHFETRQSAITWDVPDEIHSKIIAELRSTFSGPTIHQKLVHDIAVWKPSQLQNSTLSI